MKNRDSFSSRLGFILACVGSAVGMGNLWMFPTRVSLYGGGSFIIPYFIFVVLIASTGVIGEMAFGRAARSHGRCTGNGYRLHSCYGLDPEICRRYIYRRNAGLY